VAGRDAAAPYKIGAAALSALPGRMGERLAEAAAMAASYRDHDRRAMVERHLRRVVGPQLQGAALDRMVRRAFASYGRYWAEALQLPHITTQELDAGMSWTGVGYLEDAAEAGKGAILAVPHLGGWDFAGAWLCSVGYPLTVVVEPLEPPEMFEWFAEFRRSLGMEVVPLGPEAGRAVMRALRENRFACLLSDRDIGGGGVEVEFFGERTTLPAGPVTLALRTGAPLLPTGVYYDDSRGGHAGVVRPPVPLTRTGRLRDDIAAGTQLLAAELETFIRHAPDQWHVFQPNWPSDPGYRGRQP